MGVQAAQCPCGSGSSFERCCGPIIGGAAAPTAEALMRSRFTAFVRGDLAHIANTYAKDNRDRITLSAAASRVKSVEWVSLAIADIREGGEDDDTGIVEFSARFKEGGRLKLHHERSKFRREEGRWVYVDGITNPKGRPHRFEKVGRNGPCPCGSGNKYKKCCGS